MLIFVEMQVASADSFVAKDSVGGSEFGHNEAASAEIFNEAAEDRVGDSGHGSENGGGGDADVAYSQGSGKSPGGIRRFARLGRR
jgi:hypothetical protein